MTGQKIGRLTVLYQDSLIHKDEAYWICRCDCGTITSPVRGSALRNGHTLSCGCLNSKGEERIANYLSSNNVSFVREYKFPDLYGKEEKDKLRFDFAILKDNKVSLLIEYQGKQHYQDEGGYMGGENFLKALERDNKKRKYCLDNNILLLEISYKDFDKIEDILKGVI